jgi:hypothetical protein
VTEPSLPSQRVCALGQDLAHLVVEGRSSSAVGATVEDLHGLGWRVSSVMRCGDRWVIRSVPHD